MGAGIGRDRARYEPRRRGGPAGRARDGRRHSLGFAEWRAKAMVGEVKRDDMQARHAEAGQARPECHRRDVFCMGMKRVLGADGRPRLKDFRQKPPSDGATGLAII